MTNIVHLKQHLIDLELLLRQQSMWGSASPAPELLSSREPFAIDTLKPEQWLQWIFIPKMLNLIEHEQPMPCGFAIAPYFEESWKGDESKVELIHKLKAIDEVCQ
ncbi:YqcC family protein [Vibrio sp. JC009]|uniref:YqcC family protein n=1 Tax=Vibrio sp. JC009 TaxID=2912314 RepID=UPI0023AE8C6E|nr:YqcC family protein [Vibrio sp. JC009]WED21188.1 YqcC family protein [Vibrio sp. JC009]